VTELEQSLSAVRERVAAAAERARRNPDAVIIVAVTKAIAPERVEEARAAGLTVFGENKVQEAKAKIPLVSSRARWRWGRSGAHCTSRSPESFRGGWRRRVWLTDWRWAHGPTCCSAR
jgi:alkanesulfonate monooxygenase SsuD/methylene tetrahydromethanopterin reductase-like flavin-dependent oxidoreductase (luciferase family)